MKRISNEKVTTEQQQLKQQQNVFNSNCSLDELIPIEFFCLNSLSSSQSLKLTHRTTLNRYKKRKSFLRKFYNEKKMKKR